MLRLLILVWICGVFIILVVVFPDGWNGRNEEGTRRKFVVCVPRNIEDVDFPSLVGFPKLYISDRYNTRMVVPTTTAIQDCGYNTIGMATNLSLQ